MTRLAYLMFETPQPQTVARFYSEQLGLVERALPSVHDGRRTDAVRRMVGPQRELLFVEGSGCGLLEAGFAVPASGWAVAVERLRPLYAEAVTSPMFDAPALAVRDPDGNRLVFGPRTAEAVDVRTRSAARAATARTAAATALPGRLQHVGLGSAEIGPMDAFYGDTLGFAVSDRVYGDDGALRSTFVRSDPEHHTVAVFGNGQPGFDHFSLEAPDWDAIRDWADHFARFGTTTCWGPGRHGVGNNLFVFVLDPDRRMIEISAELQRVAPDAAPGRWAFDHRAYNLWGPAPLRV
jgi:catechol 2,3-dioxygenase-like lactoylglutathione lyase family enzyme